MTCKVGESGVELGVRGSIKHKCIFYNSQDARVKLQSRLVSLAAVLEHKPRLIYLTASFSKLISYGSDFPHNNALKVRSEMHACVIMV